MYHGVAVAENPSPARASHADRARRHQHALASLAAPKQVLFGVFTAEVPGTARQLAGIDGDERGRAGAKRANVAF